MSAKKITTCRHGEGAACAWCKLERELDREMEREMNAMAAEVCRKLQQSAQHTQRTKRTHRTGARLPPVGSTQPRNAPISLADERRKRQ